MMCQYRMIRDNIHIYHFRFGFDYIGLSRQLPDSSYDSNRNRPEYARLDSLLWWIPPTCSGTWLEVDMLNVYTVIGFVSGGFSLVTYDLKVSIDGISYQYMYQNADVRDGYYKTYWFENPATAKYWRMELRQCLFRLDVKITCDIIGYL